MKTYRITLLKKVPGTDNKEIFDCPVTAETYDEAKAKARKIAGIYGMTLHAISVRAKVRVKVFDDFGRICLHEIRGLKEGAVLEGRFYPENRAFDFLWNGTPAMLWVGSNAEIILTD